MCLAVPGKILKITKQDNDIEKLAVVDFHGSEVEVSLAMVPEAIQGDFILVHAGYALQILDQAEAEQTWDYLRQAGIELGETDNG